MNYNLKNHIDAFYRFCDAIDQQGIAKRFGVDVSIREVVNMEFLQFLMYLSASDGNIDWSESEFINDYLDISGISPEIMNRLIRDNNIYSTEFESRVPASLQMIVAIDNYMYQHGDDESDEHMPNLMVGIFEDLGKEFLECDGRVSGNEENDLDIYLTTLRNYVYENAERPSSTVYTNVKYQGQNVPISLSFRIGKPHFSDDDDE